MVDIENDYNTRLDELRRRIKSPRNFQSAMELALEIHAMTHTGEVSSSSVPTFCDELLNGLEDEDYSIMPTERMKPLRGIYGISQESKTWWVTF